MAICENGEIAGYVSGGCVEAAVATEALASLHDGVPRMLAYGAGSPVLDLQLTCGGRIRIFVRAVGDGVTHLKQRSEEHTSELQSIMRISYGVFCLKKRTDHQIT